MSAALEILDSTSGQTPFARLLAKTRA